MDVGSRRGRRSYLSLARLRLAEVATSFLAATLRDPG
jgi:hypothetical protein